MSDGAKVLVVDDEEAVRLVTVEMLRRMGYVASAADGGQQALARISEQQFDLVLLDLAMPEMSGAETYNALRQIAPEVPVLFMTGYSRDDLGEVLDGHCNAQVLPKPFPMQELQGAVRDMLERA
jgi:two-component system cell cycle sensor histidine kinase/response regulator CckA